MPRRHHEAVTDRPKTTNTTTTPIPEVVWQQAQETHLFEVRKNSTTEANNSTHTPVFKRRNDVKSRVSRKSETSPHLKLLGASGWLFCWVYFSRKWKVSGLPYRKYCKEKVILAYVVLFETTKVCNKNFSASFLTQWGTTDDPVLDYG